MSIIMTFAYWNPSRDAAPMNCDRRRQHDCTDPRFNRPTTAMDSTTNLVDIRHHGRLHDDGCPGPYECRLRAQSTVDQ